jgi:hypothetical protein
MLEGHWHSKRGMFLITSGIDGPLSSSMQWVWPSDVGNLDLMSHAFEVAYIYGADTW